MAIGGDSNRSNRLFGFTEGIVSAQAVFLDSVADLSLAEAEFPGGSNLYPAVAFQSSLDFSALDRFE